MTVRSTRLAAVHLTATGNVAIYTCPAGYRTILKDLHGDNAGGPAGSINILIQTADSSVTQYPVLLSQPANAAFQWQGWLVLNPGDKVIVQNAIQPVTVWLSGTILQLTGTEPI